MQQVTPRRLAATAVRLAVVGVIASVVLPLIPAWPLSLFEHFRFQYLWGALPIVVACGALGLRGWFDAALIATLVNALWVVPDLSRDARPLPAGPPLRVLVFNVHTSSSGFAAVRALIAERQPDVLGLVEVDARWLAELAVAFPYKIEEPRHDNFGVALYSRLPMTGAIEKLGSLLPTAVATVDVQGTQLGVVLTHPIPPVGGEVLAMQVAQLERSLRLARGVRAPGELPVDLDVAAHPDRPRPRVLLDRREVAHDPA